MKKSPIHRVFAYLGTHLTGFFAGIILISIVIAGTAVAQAFLLKTIMNAIVVGDWKTIRTGTLMLAGVLFFNLATQPRLWKWFMSCGPMATKDIREQTMATLLRRPMAFFETGHSGDIISRINADIGAMQGIFDVRFRRFITPLIQAIFSTAAMFILNRYFALLLIGLNLLSASLNLIFVKPIKKLSGQIQKSNGSLTERAVDMLAGITSLKIFSITEKLMKNYISESRSFAKKQTKLSCLEGGLDALNSLLGHFGNVGAVFLGAWFVSQGTLDLGSLLAFISLQADLGRSFLEAAQYFPIVQKAFAGADRLFELIDGESESEHYDYPPVTPPSESEIQLQHISFGYSPDQEILHDINLEIKRGQVVAIVGESGCGKTTLLKLILGFCRAQCGSMTIQGKPYKDFTLNEIRQLCAWVPQDPYLFDGTIGENIRFGRIEAGKEQIVTAAANANALEFIEKTADGFDTRIGQAGLRLSGGQKQRIAIARSILKDAPILLFDEATSNLDSRSEQLVQEALTKLMKNRTSIIVAHRLSTIQNADVIYVLDSGRIIESGTHEQLLAEEGTYHKLWQRLNN